MSYTEKVGRVCEYILQNLDEELTLDRLSSVAALSRFHFHRVFLAFSGMTLHRFIRLSRLKKASYQLAFKEDMRVIDIAFDAGFESPEAFARSFKNELGQTPSQFRKRPDWDIWHSKLIFSVQKGGIDMDVKIVDFKETKVAALEHKGSPELVLETAGRFISWRKETGLSPVKTSGTYGVPYNDPNVTPPDEFRFDVCGSIEQDVPENKYGVINGKIPGGRCAVTRHKGSLDNVSDTVYALYKEWLPGSGEELRDYPCFFHYVTLIPEVDECDLITDVYLPLK